jgi:hypothetical protein
VRVVRVDGVGGVTTLWCIGAGDKHAAEDILRRCMQQEQTLRGVVQEKAGFMTMLEDHKKHVERMKAFALHIFDKCTKETSLAEVESIGRQSIYFQMVVSEDEFDDDDDNNEPLHGMNGGAADDEQDNVLQEDPLASDDDDAELVGRTPPPVNDAPPPMDG